jgi:transglutaminase-like putative cysteine protease
MTNVLPDTIRRLYTDPGEYIDSDHPAVRDFASTAVPADASDREKASLLYKAVRDGIRYNPYVNMLTPETFRASSVLAAGNGYCVGKAALYAAACRVHGIPARADRLLARIKVEEADDISLAVLLRRPLLEGSRQQHVTK